MASIARFAFSRWAKAATVVGVPLALAVLELFHPHVRDPTELSRQSLPTWLLVHYLQIALFPLAALSLGLLTAGLSGPMVVLSRIALFVFAVDFVAFDTAAGVTTGVLVEAAQNAGALAAWQAPLLTVWNHPIIGGMGSPLLAVVGTTAWLVGALASAFTLRRAGASWGLVALLGVSALGLAVFRTHAWPGGPLSFGALALAAAWGQWGGAAQHSGGGR
ncbi:hypothetical protein DNA98_11575 [Meiothermus sp. Pnk-1]|nr:hypothetical protein DNA98_11575 [Meiothermus sp. Pnk-1]